MTNIMTNYYFKKNYSVKDFLTVRKWNKEHNHVFSVVQIITFLSTLFGAIGDFPKEFVSTQIALNVIIITKKSRIDQFRIRNDYNLDVNDTFNSTRVTKMDFSEYNKNRTFTNPSIKPFMDNEGFSRVDKCAWVTDIDYRYVPQLDEDCEIWRFDKNPNGIKPDILNLQRAQEYLDLVRSDPSLIPDYKYLWTSDIILDYLDVRAEIAWLLAEQEEEADGKLFVGEPSFGIFDYEGSKKWAEEEELESIELAKNAKRA